MTIHKPLDNIAIDIYIKLDRPEDITSLALEVRQFRLLHGPLDCDSLSAELPALKMSTRLLTEEEVAALREAAKDFSCRAVLVDNDPGAIIERSNIEALIECALNTPTSVGDVSRWMDKLGEVARAAKNALDGRLDDLIARSSVGQGLRNIRENGIDAELADLDEELRAMERSSQQDSSNVTKDPT